MTARVEFPDAEPNGLAAMMGGVIEGNLAAHPEREALLSKRATLSISASDIGVAVSIRLLPGVVTVRNGIIGRPNVLVEADSETLAGLSSVPLKLGLPDVTTKEGREVARKLIKGQVRVKGLLAHPAMLARLNKLLAVG